MNVARLWICHFSCIFLYSAAMRHRRDSRDEPVWRGFGGKVLLRFNSQIGIPTYVRDTMRSSKDEDGRMEGLMGFPTLHASIRLPQ